jgi:hypothetical protein
MANQKDHQKIGSKQKIARFQCQAAKFFCSKDVPSNRRF